MQHEKLIVGLMMAAVLRVGGADVIQLKEESSVRGRILVEKPGYVVVDLGFEVISIPRESIVRIGGAEETAGDKEGQPAMRPATGSGEKLYRGAGAEQGERTVRELVRELGEAVVQVRTPGGLGSGFFINEEGYLITNFHVIEGETEFSVEVYHRKEGQLDRAIYKKVRILAMNKFQDLALLKIEDEGAPKFKTVALGDLDILEVGERVFAIGSPLGLERTVTEGIVSTKTRQVEGGLYLQTTAQINPGNSGGPLFNLRGEVMGVINMKLLAVEGIGFAIPVDALKYFLKHREAYSYDTDNPSNPYRYLSPPGRVAAAEASEDKAK